MTETGIPKQVLYQTIAVTFLVSLFLTWTQVVGDSVINKDGIIYLQSAHFIALGDWQTASKMYNWLLYPGLIALISNAGGASLELAAHLLNAILTATTCALFVLTVHALGGQSKRLLWFAAIVVLCYPKLNDYRNMIIRDHGYWAFYLLACLSFIKLYRQASMLWAVLFCGSALLATLFRVEGIFFLMGLPLVLAWQHRRRILNLDTNTRKKILLLFSAAGLLLSVFVGLYLSGAIGLGKLKQIDLYFGMVVGQDSMLSSALNISRNYLNTLTAPTEHSEKLAGLILCATIISILIAETLGTLGWLYLAALGYGVIHRINFPTATDRRPWLILIAINLAVLTLFVSTQFFLTGRYPLAMALTLLLALPFVLDYLSAKVFSGTTTVRQKRFLYVAIGLFAIITLDSLISLGADKNYIKHAGLWIQEHTAPVEQIFSNDPHVMFYSGHSWDKPPRAYDLETSLHQLKKSSRQQFEYIALRISRHDNEAENLITQSLQSPPLKVFSNQRGDRVLIYKP